MAGIPLNRSVQMDDAGSWTSGGDTFTEDAGRALLGDSQGLGLGFSTGLGYPGLGTSLAQQAMQQQQQQQTQLQQQTQQPQSNRSFGLSDWGGSISLGLARDLTQEQLQHLMADDGADSAIVDDDGDGDAMAEVSSPHTPSGVRLGAWQQPDQLPQQHHGFPRQPPEGFNALRESLGEPSEALQANPQAVATTFSSTAGSAAQQILAEASQLLQTIISKLDTYRGSQAQAPYPLANEAVASFFAELSAIQQLMRSFSARIDGDLLNAQYLEPQQIDLCLQLTERSTEYKKQLELYHQELTSVAQGRPMVAAALCITGQPYPESVKQNRPVEQPTFVKLLTGARVDASNPQGAIVTGSVIVSGSSSGGNASASDASASNKRRKERRNDPPIGLENNEKAMNEQGVAIFDSLSFPNGSRLKAIRVRFSLNLPNMVLESPPTEHIVVKTNENQWWEAEGILLKKFAFRDHQDISWFRLANLLQWRYLSASRQILDAMLRPLTVHDFDYLWRQKFESKQVISQRDFEVFWEWFGPLMHKIRYQRHLCPLWLQGYVCGFLTREEVEGALAREEVGTFLIRVSERVAGRFAVAYVAQDTVTGEKEVKHYLVKDDDTAGAKKTLPDFLGGFPDLKVILQLFTAPGNDRTLGRCSKEDVLREYYSKRKPTRSDGYDDEIDVKTTGMADQ